MSCVENVDERWEKMIMGYSVISGSMLVMKKFRWNITKLWKNPHRRYGSVHHVKGRLGV